MTPICGRFAPTPSGPLHFGSLIAALGSYLHAKQQGGKWLVRIEDVDKPRSVAGAADHILRTLEQFGLYWDGPVVYQSRRDDIYQVYLQQLQRLDKTYPCLCPRKRIQQLNGHYDGHCRTLNQSTAQPYAIRFKNDAVSAHFSDGIQGDVQIDPLWAQDDFIIKRRDQLFAYQLAVVADDIEQGVTEIVRGADLLYPTWYQRALYDALHVTPPNYYHLPVALQADGRKLSKQNHAPAIQASNAASLLFHALQCLHQAPPAELSQVNAAEILRWARQHWDIKRVPAQPHFVAPPFVQSDSI